MTSVRFHPLADEELVSAIDWYLARSGRAAAGFAREIDHAIQRIGESPARYPVTRFGRRRFVLMKIRSISCTVFRRPKSKSSRLRITPAVPAIGVSASPRKRGCWKDQSVKNRLESKLPSAMAQ